MNATLYELERAIEESQSETIPLGPTRWFYDRLAPKDRSGNAARREMLLNAAFSSDAIAEELWTICSRDILFYINLFGWTLNPRNKQQPQLPFITYEYQDNAILELQSVLGDEDVAIPKSRDMGASWICLLVLEHAWHFQSLQQFLLTSWKEELVDGDSEKSLFSKLDFWWDKLPQFLMPMGSVRRTLMHAVNPETGSGFHGEATVKNLGSGDRCTAILLDETSKMPNSEAIFTSTRDVTDCRIFNSTPNGRYGTGEGFFKKVRSPDQRKIWMHWTDHPTKRRGLYKLINGEKVPLPASYDWKTDYDFGLLGFIGQNKPRSDWYDKQCKRATSTTEIAQECDIDFLNSSERFADQEVMLKVKNTTCRDAFIEGNISCDPEELDLNFTKQPRGDTRLWCLLDAKGKPPVGQYSIGVDISAGTGGAKTSESCINVFNCKTGEQVFEFANRTTTPDKLAILAVAVQKWFWGGILVPEVNGPTGKLFLRTLFELDYGDIYFREVADVGSGKLTKKIGYWNNDGGAEILGSLQRAIREGDAIVRSHALVDQFLEYEWDNGKLVHSPSKNTGTASEKGMAHGDRAIAGAAAWLGVKRRKVSTDDKKEPENIPSNCMAARLRELEEQQNANENELVFD